MSQSELNSKEQKIDEVINTSGNRKRIEASAHFSERVRTRVHNHEYGVEPIQLRWLSYAAVASVLMLLINISIVSGSLSSVLNESDTVSITAVEQYFGLDESWTDLMIEYPEVENNTEVPNTND